MAAPENSYEVGYKKPPRDSQFKPGNRANPKGRGKRAVATEAEILKRVLNFPAEFRHRGKSKRAPRIELVIKRFGASALKGDVGAAAMLLKMRARFEKNGDINPTIIGLNLSEDDMRAAYSAEANPPLDGQLPARPLGDAEHRDS